MKSIMISIHPEEMAEIITGKKTVIVCRTAPKDWRGYLSGKTKVEPKPRTAFIYCTKEDERFISTDAGDYRINGKVVAKFRLRKVKEFDSKSFTDTADKTCVLNPHTCEATSSCMSYSEIRDYCKGGIGYAWHISDLVIFDEPKGLNSFLKPNWDKGLDKALEQARKDDLKIIKRIENGTAFDDEIANCEELTLAGFKFAGMIEKAPQSWRYVEVAEE